MRQSSEPAAVEEHPGATREASFPQLPAANDTLASSVDDGLALALVCLTAAGVACFWSSDGDLGFHLATGREVLATGRIPTRNVLSFAEPDHVWQLHQWLPGVLFELLYRAGGVSAVIGLKLGVVGAIWSVAYRTARRVGASPASSALACLLGVAASSARFEARPYLFTHLTLAMILLGCAHASAAPAKDGYSAWRLCAATGGIAALGCQLHAGALDGFVALAVFAFGAAIEPLRARCFGVQASQPFGPRPATRWAIAALGGGLTGALLLSAYHPLGARILLFPLQMGSDTYLAEHLVEFRRPWAFPFATLAAYWLLLALLAAAAVARARRIHAAWLALGFVFALLSLRFVRMVFAFSIVAAPIVALAFEHTRAAAALRLRRRLAALLLIALALTLPLYAFPGRTPGFGYEPSVWPLRHFDFIRTHNLQGKVFLSDAWGGPFLGQFYPERRVFFDNRLEAYSPHFMRDVYQRIRYAQPGWDRLLDDYNIEIVLMRYTTEGESRFQHGAPNLRQQLARDPRFTLIRFDDVGELFVRTHGANAALASRFALPGIDPDRRSFTVDPLAAAAPLQRAVQHGERSATLLGLAALATAAQGQAELASGFALQAAKIAPEDAWVQHIRVQLAAAH